MKEKTEADERFPLYAFVYYDYFDESYFAAKENKKFDKPKPVNLVVQKEKSKPKRFGFLLFGAGNRI
ncbi:MAG: hypothetical protein IIW27_05575 [Clostridia bacterium]|nr:hypothetical protein [Clostridia bacterium]